MPADGLGAFPAQHREAAGAALASVCGSAPILSVSAVSGGASGAFPYRVDVGGRPYLVRIEGPPSPLRNPHQYTALRMAADAGLAPHVHYIDETARVAVTDFIAHRPLQLYPGGTGALAQALGELLQRLQATPPFPPFVHYPDIVGRLFAHVRRTRLFAAGLLDPHVERLERVSDAYTSGATTLISSHNDFIPGNILFDGERLWVIDWESAYRNDPLVDVAIALDSFSFNPEMGDVLLRAWLGHVPSDTLRARLEIVRALTRLYYAGVFLSASAAWGTTTDDQLAAPSVAEFDRAIADGRLRAPTAAAKHMMGKMYLAAFMSGRAPPGF